MMIMEGWNESSRLTKAAYRRISEIAEECAGDLGEELPDNAMTHGMITAWLRKRDDVEAKA